MVNLECRNEGESLFAALFCSFERGQTLSYLTFNLGSWNIRIQFNCSRFAKPNSVEKKVSKHSLSLHLSFFSKKDFVHRHK